jgi:Lon protease-like protein
MNINRPYTSINELPITLPLFPLGGVILLPRAQLPLNVFETKYVQMVDDVMRGHRLIGLIQPLEESPRSRAMLNKVGTVGRITHLSETGDGRYSIVLTGVARFHAVDEIHSQRLYREFRVDYREFECDLVRSSDSCFDRKELLEALVSFAKSNKMKLDWQSIDNASDEDLVNTLSMMSPLSPTAKQRLLEAKSLSERSAILVAMTEIELIKSFAGTSTLQ